MADDNRNGHHGYWQYLIKDDKSATPQFEELCLGLARIICSLEPGPPDRLSPQRLARFYREVGGNLDPIFLQTSDSILSFLYRTIGCFHSCEPTSNPFETPTVPCLTPEGFVKWQTVQLLLLPEEHIRFLQEAVRIYDVPRRDGGYFPKTIPNEVFPNEPDKQMEDWHRSVTSQMNQEQKIRKLRNSPYESPQPTERAEGYFGTHLQPRIQRPSRPSRHDSWEEAIHSHHSRRSSEPDFAIPSIGPIRHAQNPQAYFRRERQRSHSTGRPSPVSRQRSATTHVPIRTYPPSASSQRHSSSHSNERPYSAPKRPYHVDQHMRNNVRRPNPNFTPSHSSGSDSSSEDSRERRQKGRSKPRQEEGIVSSFLSALPFSSRNRRCRSHDASYEDDRASGKREGPAVNAARASADNFARPPPTVRFRHDMFANEPPYSGSSSPGGDRRRPSMPYSESRPLRNPGLTEQAPSIGYTTHHEDSSDPNSDQRNDSDFSNYPFRDPAAPSLRFPTVTGVKGRQYATADPNGAIPVNANSRDRQRVSLAI